MPQDTNVKRRRAFWVFALAALGLTLCGIAFSWLVAVEVETEDRITRVPSYDIMRLIHETADEGWVDCLRVADILQTICGVPIEVDAERIWPDGVPHVHRLHMANFSGRSPVVQFYRHGASTPLSADSILSALDTLAALLGPDVGWAIEADRVVFTPRRYIDPDISAIGRRAWRAAQSALDTWF